MAPTATAFRQTHFNGIFARNITVYIFNIKKERQLKYQWMMQNIQNCDVEGVINAKKSMPDCDIQRKPDGSIITLLMQATSRCFFGKDQLVIQHLLQCSNPNAIDRWGKSVIFHAIDHNNSIAVNILLENGANIDVKDRNGDNVFLYAVRKSAKIDIFLSLIKIGFDVNEPMVGKDGKTPLMFVAMNRNLDHREFANVFLSAVPHFDPAIEDDEGKTALVYAIANGNMAFVEFLLPFCDINRNGRYLLQIAQNAPNGWPSTQLIQEQMRKTNQRRLP